MPLDNSMYPSMQEDIWMPRPYNWSNEFAWLPHRSVQSGRIIWLCRAWRCETFKTVTKQYKKVNRWVWMTDQEYVVKCLAE